MKKILLLTFISFLAFAARGREPQTLVAERFEAFASGSENAPGNDVNFVNKYHIPDSMTAQPGWTGGGLREAGGCVYINRYKLGDHAANGYITTPSFMLLGTAVLEFRARAASADDAATLWVAVCNDEDGPGSDQMDITLGNAWRNYRMDITDPSLEYASSVQFAVENGPVLLDDVRLTFTRSRIATPWSLPVENLSETSFRARWSAIDGAKAYRLNVVRTEPIDNPASGEILEGFDGVTADGSSLTGGVPEGWTVNVSSGNNDLGTTAAVVGSAPYSIKFDSTSDTIISPELPYPLDGLSFWVRPSSTRDNEEQMSLLRLELFHRNTSSWDIIAHLPASWFQATGGVYTITPMALGNDVTRVRFTMVQRGKVDFFVDDIRLHYLERGAETHVVDNLDVEGLDHVVEGIDPALDHYFYVQAVDDEIVSAPSARQWVDGVSGLKVTALEPTAVSATAFTANWRPLGHATDYRVDLAARYAPSGNMTGVTVLREDFSGITDGTVAKPGTADESPFTFSSRGWTATAWGATQGAWAKGMAGTLGTSPYIGTAGLIFTPTLDLSCYDGSGIDIRATFVTTVDSFIMQAGHRESEGVFAMILRGPSDTQPIASGYLDTPTVGSTSGSMTIANVPDGTDLSSVIIAFMNKSGQMFFLDDVEITMNVPAGKTLTVPLTSASTTGTSYTFTGLDAATDHSYSVTASTVHEFETYTSEASEPQNVRNSEASLRELMTGRGDIATAIPGAIRLHSDADVYTPAGRLIARGRRGTTVSVAPGIYIVRTALATLRLAVI